jgi:GntR family transcriptional regulator
MTIDRRSDRALHKQLADVLRQQITAGLFGAGAALPSEGELEREHGLSRSTVRDALGLLRAEGLVITEKGRGTFVRPQQPARRVASERYRAEMALLAQTGEHPLETAFTREHGLSWDEFRVDVDFATIAAPAQVARLLNLEPDSLVLERRIVLYARDLPEQQRYSYYVWDLAGGTPLADPQRQPWPGGTLAELASVGVTVTSVEEEVAARMPSPEEEYQLDMASGVPVFDVWRVFLAGSRPVEATHMVTPADRVRLAYRIDL